MPECYSDTNLVEVLLNKPDCVNHKKSNTTIGVQMKQRLANTFAVALIDDKRRLKELDEFAKVERLCRAGLKLYEHPVRKHFFIQLSPAIEKWILTECVKGGIKVTEWGLPEGIHEWRQLKSTTQRKDARFSKLFKDMLQNEKYDEIIELKRWLDFFRDNTYNSNIDLL